MPSRPRIFVAGHNGMVGSAITRRLAREDVEILRVGRAQLDLRDQTRVQGWIGEARPDVIILAAAKVGGILANNSLPAEFLYENLIIEANIINAAHKAGVDRLVFLGSSCIYPKFASQPIVEEALLSAGRTNVQIQREIVAKIRNRAIDPQVIVSLSSQRTSLISVMGEVNTPVRYAAAAAGARDRITDALTRAGGIKGQGYETWVILERNGKRATIPFENLIMDEKNNIFVQPGDRIYVYREQQQFIAFGASGQQGEFPFNAWRINLAEAVAKAGGLVDGQANPGSVFLYRREPKAVAARLGVDVSRFSGDLVPIIFSTSFRDPSGYFLATKVEMRNQDIIFVANAEAVEVTKFLIFMNAVVGTAANTETAVTGAYAVKASANWH